MNINIMLSFAKQFHKEIISTSVSIPLNDMM